MAPLKPPLGRNKYIELKFKGVGKRQRLQCYVKGGPRVLESHTAERILKYLRQKGFTSVQNLNPNQTKATMEGGKMNGEEAEDNICMNLEDHDLFPNDNSAPESIEEEGGAGPIVDAVLPQMGPPEHCELGAQARVALNDIGLVLRQAGYPLTALNSDWTLEEEGSQGNEEISSPPTSSGSSAMQVEAKGGAPEDILEEDSGLEHSQGGESVGPQAPSQPIIFPQEEASTSNDGGPPSTNRETQTVDLVQPTEETTQGNPNGNGNPSGNPQKKGTRSPTQVCQEITAMLGFEIDPKSGHPPPQEWEEIPSGTCCGAKKIQGFQLHLLECVEATKARAAAKACPFETTTPFLGYVRLPEDKWLIKLAPQVNGNGDLIEFLRMAIPNSQELHRETLRLFERVATESCQISQCFGKLVPLMAETYSYSWRVQSDPAERYQHLTHLHDVWRNKRLGLEFLEMAEGVGHHDGQLDCQQFDHCCSGQLKSEVAALVERSLYLNLEMQRGFNGLGYLSAVQQSLAQTIMSSWEQDLSRCRYLLSIIRRRRIVIDARRGLWYNLLGPSASVTKEGTKEMAVNDKNKSWPFVKTGTFEEIAIQSKLLGLKGGKQKATPGQAIKAQAQKAKRSERVSPQNQLPSLELYRMLVALTQQEGVRGKEGLTGNNPMVQQVPPPTTKQGHPRDNQSARQRSSRSPSHSKREWKDEKREPVKAKGDRGLPPKGLGERSSQGHRESSHRGERRRPRSSSREEAALEYSRDPRGTNVFKRVGGHGHKRRNRRGGHTNRSHYDHYDHYDPVTQRHYQIRDA